MPLLPLALLGPIGTPEMIVIGIVGLLIFGRRLPEVGKSLGKGIVEFKKGLSGIEDELSADAKAAGSGPTSVVVDNQQPAIERQSPAVADPTAHAATEKSPA